MKHLLSAADLDRDSALSILDEAERLKETLLGREVRKLPTLRGKTVLTVFYENSTRTRVSFETAGKWMSADVINVSASASSVQKGESLRDTALTLTAIGADALIVRHPASGSAQQIAGWVAPGGVGPSVINAGDGMHEHPTQALLDAYTIERRLGSLRGKRIAIVGDVTHSRVFRSNVLSLPRLGAQVTVVAPPTLMPSGATSWARAQGFALSNDLDEVIDSGVDALMMLRVQRERMSGGYFPTAREYTVGYGLTRDRLTTPTSTSPHAVICHPGPMNRGLEIAADAADGASSLVLDQVSAGVAVRMSVLYHLLASGLGEQGDVA